VPAPAPTGDDRFARAVAAIDAANADDPNTLEVRGQRRPKELAHAELMTEWVGRLLPGASDELRLAARAHHLRRWALARSSYPDGRAGYLRWRRDQHRRHAEGIGRILGEVGYEEATISRVQVLVAKRDQPARGVADDPEMRALEDALCLVFVETQLHDLAARLDHEHAVEVVARTLRKMSQAGIAAALDLPLAPAERALIAEAVGSHGSLDDP
jgi:Domain of unknown function (DUF4202)